MRRFALYALLLAAAFGCSRAAHDADDPWMQDAVEVGRVGLEFMQDELAARGMRLSYEIAPLELFLSEDGQGDSFMLYVIEHDFDTPPACDDDLAPIFLGQLREAPSDRFDRWAARVEDALRRSAKEDPSARYPVECETSLPVFDSTRSHALLYVHVRDPNAREGWQSLEGWVLCFSRLDDGWVVVDAAIDWVS